MSPAGLERVAWDSSGLFSPFDRRFIMATCELLGGRAVVLPQVAREMHGILADNEEDHWIKVLGWEERRGQRSYAPDEKDRICAAAGFGIKDWVRDEIDAQAKPKARNAPDSALALHALTPSESGRARDIAQAIPDYCFRGQSKDGHWGDRQIIGQAVVAGYHVLASKNRRSVKRPRINVWCRETHGVNEDLMQEADDVMQDAVSGMGRRRAADDAVGPGDEVFLKAVLLAAMPGHDVAPDRFAEIVENFMDRLENSETFPECADGAWRAWRSDLAPSCIQSVRPLLADSPTRATEQRRLNAVHSRARGAGWRSP